MDEANNLNIEHLKKAIDYHGPLLLRKLQATRPRDWLSSLKIQPKDFTYDAYKARSRNLTGMKKAFDIAFEIMNFSSLKSQELFNNIPQEDDVAREDVMEADCVNDRIVLNNFLPIDDVMLKSWFYQNLKVNDIIIGIVNGKTNGTEQWMDLICFGDQRIMDLSNKNILVSLMVSNKTPHYTKMAFVKAIVVSYQPNTRTIKVSVDKQYLPPKMEDIELGEVKDWDESVYFKNLRLLHMEIPPFNDYLINKKFFKNASSIEHQASQFNIPIENHYSLMRNLDSVFIGEKKKTVAPPKPIKKSPPENIKTVSDIQKSVIDSFIETERELNCPIKTEKSPVKEREDSPVKKKIKIEKGEEKHEDNLSPLAQKLAQQEGNWHPPSYVNTTASFHPFPPPHWMGQPPPGYGFNVPPPHGHHGPPSFMYDAQFSEFASSLYQHPLQESRLKDKMNAFIHQLQRPTRKRSRSHSPRRSYGDRRRSRSASREYRERERGRERDRDRREERVRDRDEERDYERYHRYKSRSRSKDSSRESSSSREKERGRSKSKKSSRKTRSKSRKASESSSTSDTGSKSNSPKEKSRSRSKSLTPIKTVAKNLDIESSKSSSKRDKSEERPASKTSSKSSSKKDKKSKKKSEKSKKKDEEKESSKHKHKKKKTHKKKKDKDKKSDIKGNLLYISPTFEVNDLNNNQ